MNFLQIDNSANKAQKHKGALMTFTDFEDILVDSSISLIEAIKIMNETSKQLVLVVDDSNKLIGIIADGDIRRALATNIQFESPVDLMMNRNPRTLTSPANKKKALSLMKKHDVKHIPVVDDNNRVTGLLIWKDLVKNGDIQVKEKPNTVVIMAGGKGTRLDLFTKILPKPLIPIGEKPIIERIMDNFSKFGFKNFLISLNYKADMIKLYLSENHQNYNIKYIQEDTFLGTAGALSLAKGPINDTMIVTNCDVIVDANFDKLFQYHKDNKNAATIMGSMRNVKIPYGVLQTNNGDLEKIDEKPEFNFVINSGIYILEPEILNLIPYNKPMDMPDLLLSAKLKGYKVQVYPVTCSWFDVGQWAEYKLAIDHMNSLGAIN